MGEGNASSRHTSSRSVGASAAVTGRVLHSVNSPPPGRGKTSAGLGSESVKSGRARLIKPLRKDSISRIPCAWQRRWGCSGGGGAAEVGV